MVWYSPLGYISSNLLDVNRVPADGTGLALVERIELLHVLFVQLKVVDVRVRADTRGVGRSYERDVTIMTG